MIINSATGITEGGTNSITYSLKYNSGLPNPKVVLKMYRRNYTNLDDTTYSIVDANNYFEDLVGTSVNYEYLIEGNPTSEFTHTLTFKDSLISGTYRMEFKLYDGNAAIGSVIKYIIIK